MYNCDNVRNLSFNSVKDRKFKRNEIVMTYHHLVNSIVWLSKKEMTFQMKQWKEQIKYKVLTKPLECNNICLNIGGKDMYSLVIQPTDDDLLSLDPIGMANGFMVDGFIYWFSNESNRNMVFKYLTK